MIPLELSGSETGRPAVAKTFSSEA